MVTFICMLPNRCAVGVISFSIGLVSFAQEWSFRFVNNGIKPSIAVDSKGNPHMAYMLESTAGGFVSHAELVNDSIVSQEIALGYFYGPLDIAVDQNDLPHIVFHNHDLEDQNHYFRNNSGQWVLDGIADSGHDGWDASIAFDQSGYPHTSSVDPSGFSGGGIEYAVYNGTNWVVEDIGSLSIMYSNSTSLAIDNNNQPHISYYNDILRRLELASKIGGSWQLEVVDSAFEAGRFSSLVLTENNDPAISYYQHIDETKGIVKFAEKSNGTWSISVVDTLFNVEIGMLGARNLTSLQKDVFNKLHLAYGDRKIIKYAQLINNSWQIETVLDASSQESLILGAQQSLAVDDQLNLHLTYYEITKEDTVTDIPIPMPDLTGKVNYAFRRSLILGIENVVDDSFFQIIPNPNQGSFTLKIDLERGEHMHITIYNMMGEVVMNKKINSNKPIRFKMNPWISPGIYILRLTNGKSNHLKRLILSY